MIEDNSVGGEARQVVILDLHVYIAIVQQP